jgi:hypothetical protein
MRSAVQYNFETISDYCIKLQNYTIAKVKVDGKWWFECWNMQEFVKKFKTPDEARRYVIQKVEDQNDFKKV